MKLRTSIKRMGIGNNKNSFLNNLKNLSSKKILKESLFLIISVMVFVIAGASLWIASLQLPDFNNFENRAVANSTKIYDRTGKVVLYNIHDNIKRTEVPLADISPYIRQATVSIEDSHFYEHNGFRPLSFLRAVFINIKRGGYSQGGSTITQQVVKNALLTRDKTITRKIKEIILAVKLDSQLDKDAILQIYLNESPYGGTMYGVEEASLSFFNKHASEIGITEAAYLASLPQAPTYLSPFGKHRDALEDRKNLVLQKMFELGYISLEEKNNAQAETLEFSDNSSNNGSALHFVFYIREYLAEMYGEDAVTKGGLKVISTIDLDLQKKAEEIVKAGALANDERYKASNASMVAIDPKTGQILSMVGSRDFFDKKIPGQFNIATAERQPGSSFKPIVYAAAFAKGYTPETIVYDVPTQFSTACDAYGNPLNGNDKSSCYMPNNYDDAFRGPLTLRSALAQSLNIPAVKVLYLTGLSRVITLAQDMGLSTIKDPKRYGLSLVLGGGEITLLELTNAYGVFADNGYYHKPVGILEIKDREGSILEKYSDNEKLVLPENVTSLISSVLSDNIARTPTYGSNSKLYFGERPVAVKTGTTNDYRDVWVVGYTPSLVIGMWAGNNNNSPIDKRLAGLVVAPIWRSVMDEALKDKPIEYFPEPIPNTKEKLMLKGEYCTNSGVHNILHFVDKNDPDGPAPSNPGKDSQYYLWENGLQSWLSAHPLPCGNSSDNTNNEDTFFEDALPLYSTSTGELLR